MNYSMPLLVAISWVKETHEKDLLPFIDDKTTNQEINKFRIALRAAEIFRLVVLIRNRMLQTPEREGEASSPYHHLLALLHPEISPTQKERPSFPADFVTEIREAGDLPVNSLSNPCDYRFVKAARDIYETFRAIYPTLPEECPPLPDVPAEDIPLDQLLLEAERAAALRLQEQAG